jgi:hypothetical protein
MKLKTRAVDQFSVSVLLWQNLNATEAQKHRNLLPGFKTEIKPTRYQTSPPCGRLFDPVKADSLSYC